MMLEPQRVNGIESLIFCDILEHTAFAMAKKCRCCDTDAKAHEWRVTVVAAFSESHDALPTAVIALGNSYACIVGYTNHF